MASIYEGLLNMLSVLVAVLSAGSPADATRDSLYPPLNHTTFITNASLGTYGGVYTAPADQASPPLAANGYNYCSMPHPRAETYSLPPPVANQSVAARLVYLEYLQRHHRRTPYNILPGGEVCLIPLRKRKGQRMMEGFRTKNITATTCMPMSTARRLPRARHPSQSMVKPIPIPPTHS